MGRNVPCCEAAALVWGVNRYGGLDSDMEGTEKQERSAELCVRCCIPLYPNCGAWSIIKVKIGERVACGSLWTLQWFWRTAFCLHWDSNKNPGLQGISWALSRGRRCCLPTARSPRGMLVSVPCFNFCPAFLWSNHGRLRGEHGPRHWGNADVLAIGLAGLACVSWGNF